MKKITIIMSVSMLLSCGPSANDNERQKEKSNLEIAITEQKTEEFTVRAVGNTMAEMKFDIPNITVKEGSKVKITLINEGSDPAMLHNIVFINYGSRKEIAMQAIESASTKYIPNNSNVIAGSDLAKPGETIVLEFNAPKRGNYEFLCTYPGHAEIMRGYFFVK
tara:strand:- start:344 stop:835 length:492 start_codon:yes stop_codon:yes gene_type:complete